MVQLIKPNAVKVITKDGEIQVSLSIELNINLNTDGINFNTHVEKLDAKQEKTTEKTNWEIPDFENIETINFGKKEK